MAARLALPLVMRVHIPKARNEKLARAVHSRRSARDGDRAADVRNLTGLRHDYHPRFLCATGNINERHVGDRDRATRLKVKAGLDWLVADLVPGMR
jgi:hypothetical protein